MTAIQRSSAFAQFDRKRSWFGPSLRTLRQSEFDASCAELMRLVEQEYKPTLVVGIRTGGLVVAKSMVRNASVPLPVLPVTCRRAATEAKSRLPLFRTVLAALPRPAVDLLRRVEHRLFIAPRVHQTRPQLIDRTEVDSIAHWLGRASRSKILVTDDAVDSGVTLGTVLHHLSVTCPPDTEIRTAVITQTLEQPATRPDYALYHGTLCRFPWSFDAAG